MLEALQVAVPILRLEVLEAAVSAAAVTSGELCDLFKYIVAEPEALVAASSSAPRVFGRLVRILRESGATNVVLPRCAACDSERPLLHPSPEGRICARCFNARRAPEACVACGKVTVVHARTAKGALCKSCRTRDPDSWSSCVSCGRLAPVEARGETGPLCARCYEPPSESCSSCEKSRSVGSRRGGVVLCPTCYARLSQPRRPCGGCGRVLPVNRRAKGADPDLCNSCNAAPLGRCSRCTALRPITRRREGQPLCWHCVLVERVDALLSDDTGTVPSSLSALRDVLLGGTYPKSTLHWLSRGGGGKLLVTLSKGGALSHRALDDLAGSDRAKDYLRSLLVASGALPEQNLEVERLSIYVGELAALLEAPEDRQLFLAFAQWQVLRRFRQKAERRPVGLSATYSRAVARAAVQFLTTLRSDGRELGECRQTDVDRFVSSSAHLAGDLRPFLNWALKRRSIAGIEAPRAPRGAGSAAIEQAEHFSLARRLHHDDSLDVGDRVAGALVVIYAQPASRVARLSREQLSERDGVLFLRLGAEPLAIPEPLAALLRLLPCRRQDQTGSRVPSPWLFPGRLAGRPMNPESLRTRLGRIGVECRPQRSAALLHLASELPSAVISDLLGVDVSTAEHWVHVAGGTWGRYAADRAGLQRDLAGSM